MTLVAQHAVPLAPAMFEAPAAPGDAIGIYLHVPFCSHVCSYCDFNTYAGQERLIPRYVDALCREIDHYSDRLAGRSVATIFFGGGTPSLLDPCQIARLLNRCRDNFAIDDAAEVTIEANPNGLDAAYLGGALEAGVNRISLGAQTLAKRGLRVLGRLHDRAEIDAAVRAARDAGVGNLSLDLIFGWPGQRTEEWRDDLDRVLAGEVGGSAPEHLSLYSLILEPGTPMADAVARGILPAPDDELSADLYEIAIARMSEAGWHHYEVANWARAKQLASCHNAVYWRNGDYLGCGAGAHGHLAGVRWMNQLAPAAYCEAVESGKDPISNVERISPETAAGETMMLGLRLLEDGVSDDAFRRRHGFGLDEAFGRTIPDLVGLGLLDRRPDRVRLSPRGLMLANDVCARFLP